MHEDMEKARAAGQKLPNWFLEDDHLQSALTKSVNGQKVSRDYIQFGKYIYRACKNLSAFLQRVTHL